MNSTCRDVGHDWQNTTSDTFRKCQRQDCKATQRLHRGSWVDVARIVKREEPTHEPIQGMMFR